MKRPEAIAKTSWILTLASIAVVVAALYLAKALLIPLTLAVLLSFMLSPICGWMERWRLSRIPAVLMTAFFGFSLLGIVLWLVVVQLTSLSPKIPEYQHNIGAKFNTVNQYAVTLLSKLTKTAEGMGQNLSASTPIEEPRGTLELPFSVRVLTSPASPLQVFGGMYGTLLEVLGSTSIVIVLVIFFLVRREDLRDRFIHLIGKTQITLTTQTIEDAGARVSRYLSTLLLINLAFGISVDWAFDGHLNRLARASVDRWAVCGARAFQQQLIRALGLRQEYRRVGGSCLDSCVLLDVVVGTSRASAGNCIDRLYSRGRQARP